MAMGLSSPLPLRLCPMGPHVSLADAVRQEKSRSPSGLRRFLRFRYSRLYRRTSAAAISGAHTSRTAPLVRGQETLGGISCHLALFDRDRMPFGRLDNREHRTYTLSHVIFGTAIPSMRRPVPRVCIRNLRALS